jgi:hypothetical protein
MVNAPVVDPMAFVQREKLAAPSIARTCVSVTLLIQKIAVVAALSVQRDKPALMASAPAVLATVRPMKPVAMTSAAAMVLSAPSIMKADLISALIMFWAQEQQAAQILMLILIIVALVATNAVLIKTPSRIPKPMLAAL